MYPIYIVISHSPSVGYKKINKTLKLSCSTVAKTIQRFNGTGSTQNRPRHGRPKKLSAHAQRHIQRLCLWNRRMSAASIAAEVEGVGGQPVSAQTISRTLQQIGLHGCRPRRKPLLKMMHRKPANSLLKTSRLRTWITMWFRWCQACVVATRWGVQRQVCLAYSQAWWWECHGLGLQREPWMPTCTVTYWSRAWSPPFGDWAAGQYSNMITTTALRKKLRVKVMDWPSMSPDINPIEHLWGILKRKVEERKISNIHQLSDVVMEEWKRTPVATCEVWSSGELHTREG